MVERAQNEPGQQADHTGLSAVEVMVGAGGHAEQHGQGDDRGARHEDTVVVMVRLSPLANIDQPVGVSVSVSVSLSPRPSRTPAS